MEQLSSQGGDINPIPLNTSYGGGGGGNVGVVHVHGHHTHGHGHQILQHHHNHHPPSHHHNNNNNNNIIIPPSSSSSPPQATTQIITPPPASNGLVQAMPISSTPSLENNNDDKYHQLQNHQNATFKKTIKYKECLKNHAASMGGNATDGCGEFMPSGEEGTIEALTCSACNCHRNFHRKELEGDHHHNDITAYYPHHHNMMMNPTIGATKIFEGHPQNALGYHHHHHHYQFPSSRAVNAQPRQMIMSYESDHDVEDQAAGNNMLREQHHHHQIVKKRHRTKFTQEQKEKMLVFAERVGWKIQKQEEAVVQQFCQEVGVKRRVLKVWMHNNKHNLAKKNVANQQQQSDHSQNQV